jgi:proline iminopeptidase
LSELIALPGRGLALAVERSGASQGVPVLLLMGMGLQLTAWPERFLKPLESLHPVIRFDMRGLGLSETGAAAPHDSPSKAVFKYLLGGSVKPAYHLDDLAIDAIALMDALGLAKAHLVGLSLGGMVAQKCAAKFPERVASLTLLMTCAGVKTSPYPEFSLFPKILKRPKTSAPFETILKHFMQLFVALGHITDAAELAHLEQMLSVSIKRAYRPVSTNLQLLALLADPDFSASTRQLKQRCLIVHGKDDPLLPFQNGYYLKQLMPHAFLKLVPGLGHYLPLALCEPVADLILAHVTG